MKKEDSEAIEYALRMTYAQPTADRLMSLIKKLKGKCTACGTITERRKEGTNIFLCIDCSH